MINIFINKKEYVVPKNLTILQACEYIGLIIPNFCYNESLQIAGNCRMCLVELNNSPKPVASCAMVISEGISVLTNSPRVQKVRENILEFLLINHPLDCPICDQGGECDLQDQSLFFGSDRSRFYKIKRSVSDKSFNPLIKGIMSRCIHCTRCVRFLSEFSGISFLGTLGRGEKVEIGTYINKNFKSELSGNIIDLCPVGALTSKPFAFKGRSWELKRLNILDTFDVFGNSIEINYKGDNIFRVLPYKVYDIESNWISDRTRFSYDSFNLQRLNQPLIKKGNQYIKVSWKKAFFIISKIIKKGSLTGVIGENSDIDSIFIFKKFLNSLGSSNLILDSFLDSQNLNQDFKLNYL